ncbi:hypothetical protein HYQ46_012191 [Verticillium longisporum]|nr:hypothetical protein HYQ46_012191 [Verticillium longisporum]
MATTSLRQRVNPGATFLRTALALAEGCEAKERRRDVETKRQGMTVPVSHYERPGSSGTGPQVKSEYDDLGYSAVQFSVDSLDADVVNFEAGKDAYHGGSTAAHNEAMDWGSAMPADDLRFDDFLDLDSMSHTGDEWPDQPDSLFFDMPALDGSTSTTSVSGDFDDLLSSARGG